MPARVQGQQSLSNCLVRPMSEDEAMSVDRSAASLHWQSKLVLLLVVPFAAMEAIVQLVDVPSLRLAATGALVSLLFAALVLAARAATPAAAALGALLAFCFALIPAYPHSSLWPLAAMLVLTLGASRIGRRVKEAQGTAEGRRGRTASQVAANLGVAALAATLINPYGMVLAQAALLAALGEAAADTLASELGQLSTSPPRMLLTLRKVPAGTDGAVSPLGTLAGVLGALLITLLGRWCFALAWPVLGCVVAGAIFGFVLDSVLGELIERRGWINNDLVNYLGTLGAALCTLVAGRFLG